MTKNSIQNCHVGDFLQYFAGEYKLQHRRQLGEPCERGAQLSVLWKNFLVEGAPGQTHRDAAQGLDKDLKPDKDCLYKLSSIERRNCVLLTHFLNFQAGEGDGMESRDGISVTHYPEHFKEEVVAFAKATSQKDAKDRLSTDFNSTI